MCVCIDMCARAHVYVYVCVGVYRYGYVCVCLCVCRDMYTYILYPFLKNKVTFRFLLFCFSSLLFIIHKL